MFDVHGSTDGCVSRQGGAVEGTHTYSRQQYNVNVSFLRNDRRT